MCGEYFFRHPLDRLAISVGALMLQQLELLPQDLRFHAVVRTELATPQEHADLQLAGPVVPDFDPMCGDLVIAGARRINSCLTLAVMHDGDMITTIEGLGLPGNLHPMQQAFVVHDGYQCGYCTPGQICSAVAVLDEIKAGIPSHVTADLTGAPTVTRPELRERMSGNICRCGA